MDDRGRILLTLRRAEEAEAKRSLGRSRRAVEVAVVALDRTQQATALADARSLAASVSERALRGGGGSAEAHGRAASFGARRRDEAAVARGLDLRAALDLDQARVAFDRARAALEEAVHRREAAEADAARRRKERARGRERREQAAVDDLGRRPPRR